MLRLPPPAIAIAAVAMIGIGATGMAFAGEVQGKVLMGPMCPGPFSGSRPRIERIGSMRFGVSDVKRPASRGRRHGGRFPSV